MVTITPSKTHPMRRALVAILLIGSVAASPAFAEINLDAARNFRSEGVVAYRDGDYEQFTVSMEKALAENPMSLATRYNVAAGYALTGRDEEALEQLGMLVTARVDFGIADDEDFASLRASDEYQRLLQDLENSLVPVSNSRQLISIDRYGIIPEGIAVDPTDGRLFISSMRTGDIYAIDSKGEIGNFATVEHTGKMAAIGLTVDTDRQLLWSVGASFSMVEDFDPQATPETGLFGFDLATGELKRRILADEGVGGFNDVALAPSGDIYLSGSQLSVLSASGSRLQPLETDPVIGGTNGITVSGDGKTLFVSSYPSTVAAIDLESGRARYVKGPADTPLYAIDGLYWYEGDLIAVQNGVKPWRLLRIDLDDADAAQNVRYIEFANESIEPTTGAIIDGQIHYVGTGPAPDTTPDGFPEDLKPFLGKTIVMSAPLEPD